MDIRRSAIAPLFLVFLSLSVGGLRPGLAQDTRPPALKPSPAASGPGPQNAFLNTPMPAQSGPGATTGESPQEQPAKTVALNGATCPVDDGKVPGPPPASGGDKSVCSVGRNIYLFFDNLTDWAKGISGAGKPNRIQDIALSLNGKILKGVPAIPAGDNVLQFQLNRLDLIAGDQDTQDNRAAWNALMSRAKFSSRPIGVGVVMPDGTSLAAKQAVVNLRDFPDYWWAVCLFMLALLLLFLVLAAKSDILRDGPTAAAAPGPWWKFGIGSGPKNSFSLARCQMAWWFFIVLASYLYIWMIFGDTDTLTAGALVLMGISAATGFSSFLVDSSKENQRQALTAEQTALTARLAALAAGIAADPANAALTTEQQLMQARLDQVNRNLATLPSPVGFSQGFFKDILQDETGVSFHRFQMATWTIVLGFVFAVAVHRNLAMPDFSPTLLGLMGVSAGTYVGFKIPDPPK